MNNTSILDTILSNIDKKRAKNMERRMMLAVKIAEGIKKKGLSQKEFAEKMCKRPSEISKWLKGDHNFTTSTLFDIEDVLDIHIMDLNEQEEYSKPIKQQIVLSIKSENESTNQYRFFDKFNKKEYRTIIS